MEQRRLALLFPPGTEWARALPTPAIAAAKAPACVALTIVSNGGGLVLEEMMGRFPQAQALQENARCAMYNMLLLGSMEAERALLLVSDFSEGAPPGGGIRAAPEKPPTGSATGSASAAAPPPAEAGEDAAVVRSGASAAAVAGPPAADPLAVDLQDASAAAIDAADLQDASAAAIDAAVAAAVAAAQEKADKEAAPLKVSLVVLCLLLVAMVVVAALGWSRKVN